METKKTPMPKHMVVVLLIATNVEQGGDYKVLEINNISNKLPRHSQRNKKEKIKIKRWQVQKGLIKSTSMGDRKNGKCNKIEGKDFEWLICIAMIHHTKRPFHLSQCMKIFCVEMTQKI